MAWPGVCGSGGLASGSSAVVFFFQAEDGIRDYKVTGVQTCALPIYCQRIFRSTTTKRLDSAVESRCRCTRANIRCEVDDPISIPTVVSSTLSAAQATSLTATSSGLT